MNLFYCTQLWNDTVTSRRSTLELQHAKDSMKMLLATLVPIVVLSFWR